MKKTNVRAAVCRAYPAMACTGISLTAKDGSYVQARTVEGSQIDLSGEYVVLPRGLQLHSLTPIDTMGMEYRVKYGVVGLAVIQKEFITEGINEKGLSAGLFFFPHYGSYELFQEDKRAQTIGDLQLNQWMLSQFSTVDEVVHAISSRTIHIVGLDHTAVVHWRIADATGRQVVLEIVDGIPHFYENTVGVITNAPGFQWHLTNLNNYVNLFSGDAPQKMLGLQSLVPMGGNSGFLGIPGDNTSPSRFVRAAFYRATAPQCSNAFETVKQCFHILNNFDIPIGVEHPIGSAPRIPSATHWISVIDLTHRIVYFNTAYNNTIRCIDLAEIDFNTIPYQSFPFDVNKEQPVQKLQIQ